METENEKIDAQMRNIIEEARVILPGLQALFGFQTIAVFSERFDDLETYAKTCHLLGLAMVIVAVAMVMTPAVYYRACRGHATVSMVQLSGTIIRGALAPLAFGLALDMFTVFYAVTSNLATSVFVSLAVFALLAGLWFILPARGRRQLPRREKELHR
jgi:uncharacterized membrane protein YidH (DUF202 family)